MSFSRISDHRLFSFRFLVLSLLFFLDFFLRFHSLPFRVWNLQSKDIRQSLKIYIINLNVCKQNVINRQPNAIKSCCCFCSSSNINIGEILNVSEFRDIILSKLTHNIFMRNKNALFISNALLTHLGIYCLLLTDTTCIHNHNSHMYNHDTNY